MTHHDHDEHESPIERVEEEMRGEAETLGAEFREFGRQLMRAVRAVANSEELRELGDEIAESLRELGEGIQETVERTRQKDEVREAAEQAKRMTRKVTEEVGAGEVTGSLSSGLSQALRALNTELNKVIDQVQAGSARMSREVEGSAREAEVADAHVEQEARVEESFQRAPHDDDYPDTPDEAFET